MSANLSAKMSATHELLRPRSIKGQSSAESFLKGFGLIMGKLLFWEQEFSKKASLEKEISFNIVRSKIYSDKKINFSSFSDPEQSLFARFLDLFALRNCVGPTNEILFKQLQEKNGGKYISFLGPLGVGKSTVSKILLDDLNADFVIREPYSDNPFWQQSQIDGSYMFRSQLYFLLSNIYSDIKARINKGRSVSDTSALTDSLMWVEWYLRTGHLSETEYRSYQEAFTLLQPIIPKPDLLVALLPEEISTLKQGIINRQADDTDREGELIFTAPDNNDLAIQTEIVEQLIESIPKIWNVDVLGIRVDQLEIFKNPSINYDYVYQIRSKLGLLGELLRPKPEEIVTRIRNILSEANKGQVVIIHAKSMFSGKTTVLCQLAEKVGVKKVIAFQPRAAIRWPEQESAIVSRDGPKVKAQVIEDNSLNSVLKFIKEHNISAKRQPYLLIDEVMLFLEESKKHQKAIDILEELRHLGFRVIINGIDYTFAQEPFTFMHKLLRITGRNKHWHAIEMSTRCRYCDKVAIGTRRIKNGEIADYNDTVFLPGDKELYEPVCGKEHISCEGQPTGFTRQELPV